MKNWRVWVLTDKDGNELARGRKRDVTNVAFRRYVYQHIFTDNLYKTKELLIKQSRQALFFSSARQPSTCRGKLLYHTAAKKSIGKLHKLWRKSDPEIVQNAEIFFSVLHKNLIKILCNPMID